MKYIESPKTYKLKAEERGIFLAGGITGTPNWQQEVMQLLEGTDLILFNPRRKNFPMNDAKAAEEQIRWGTLGTLLTMLNNSVVNSFDGQDGWADGYSLYGLEKRGSIDGYREKR